VNSSDPDLAADLDQRGASLQQSNAQFVREITAAGILAAIGKRLLPLADPADAHTTDRSGEDADAGGAGPKAVFASPTLELQLNSAQAEAGTAGSGAVAIASAWPGFSSGIHLDAGAAPEETGTDAAVTTRFAVSQLTAEASAITEVAGDSTESGSTGAVIRGGDGNDLLIGTAGDDVLLGGAGNDTLLGGEGDDVLDGGTGADVMAGGAGDDVYLVDDSSDVVVEQAGEGIDTIVALTATVPVVDLAATPHVENLVASGTADFTGIGNGLDNIIASGGGDDVLLGGAGDDVLTAGAGDDVLDGGTGADVMAGGAGDDVYIVDDAADVVVELEGEGSDTIVAATATVPFIDLGDTPGVESLVATGDADFTGIGNVLDNEITSGGGDDVLLGGAGDDVLTAGAGDDVLDGGAGADVMAGGAGDDVYLVDDAADAVIEQEGEGVDTIVADTATVPVIDLGATPAVENLQANGSADFVGIGNDLDNTITSGAGDDILLGGAGDDVLAGGAGDDVLDGGTGIDLMAGGTGDDVYLLDNSADVVIEFEGGGIDTIVVETTTVPAYSLAATPSVENLEASGIADFVGIGNDLDNTITGAEGSDTLVGAAGSDTLLGGLGSDLLDGGIGGDLMAGGAGNDTYVVDDLTDIVLEAPGEGLDTVETSLDTYALDSDVENLTYTGGGDFIGFGNDLDNIITGGDGDDGDDVLCGDHDQSDSLLGDSLVQPSAEAAVEPAAFVLGDIDDTLVFANEFVAPPIETEIMVSGDFYAGSRRNDAYVDQIGGDDTLIGGRGNDTIDGGAGDDVISGGDDNDWLVGGSGNDLLTGGEDHDVFVFRKGFGIDTITDFDLDDDHDEIMIYADAFDSLDALEANIHQVGDDVVITVTADDHIILQNIDKMRLSIQDHFSLG
jgi:Ca2+-binding RTX toxin-like protein